MDSFKIDQWRKNIVNNNCAIQSVRTLHTINKRDNSPLFSLLDASVVAPEGYRLPNVVFIRGNAVIVVPQVINQETGEERFLMVRQRRIGSGGLSLEFPAGMIDHEGDDPAEVGSRELFEETGVELLPRDLFVLSPAPLYSSSGASDEAIFYYGCRTTLPPARFDSLHNGRRGNADDDEHITVELHTRPSAEHQVSSLQARLGFFLFDEWLRTR
jgi:8-oxo-dGTP pyrophosphatase MutT (NUDIX family)